MRMSQYVYFQLLSETVTAANITAELMIEPDRVRVAGSKQASPRPLPRAHSWELHCVDTSQPIDSQATLLLERIAPVAQRVRDLVDQGEVDASLVIVRYFNDDEGEEELIADSVTPDGVVLEHIRGQHQLLGWYFEPEQLALLSSMRASISADEYG